MYLSETYDCEDTEKQLRLITAFPFSVLYNVENRSAVSYLPLVPLENSTEDKQEWFPCLIGHLDKQNPILQSLFADDVVAIFLGPNGYISPRDYVSKQFPTWNYSFIEVHGRLTSIDDFTTKKAWMINSIISFEQCNEFPLDASSKQFHTMLDKVVFLKLEPTKIYSRFKYSQEKSLSDRDLAAQRLLAKNEQSLRNTINFVADLDEN